VFDDETIRCYQQAIARPGALTAALNYYRAMGRYGAGDLFRSTGMRVTVPTLLIWGEQDVAFAPEVVQGTERFVPDLRICIAAACVALGAAGCAARGQCRSTRIPGMTGSA
jgi:pimeloyl-ACP methyl ester carboxylesterase